jgi:hypothetical protein
MLRPKINFINLQFGLLACRQFAGKQAEEILIRPQQFAKANHEF